MSFTRLGGCGGFGRCFQFLQQYSSVARSAAFDLRDPGSIPGVDSATFLCVLFLLLLVVVVGAASIMVLMARSEGVGDEIGRSGAHDEVGGEIGDEIGDEIRRAVMRYVV